MYTRQDLPHGILCQNQTTESQREIINAVNLFGHEGNLAFNESLSMTFNGHLDIDFFLMAVARLVKRHDALRTTFDHDGQRFYVHHKLPAEIKVIDLSDVPDAKDQLKDIEHGAVASEFDIFTGPLVRFSIVKMKTHHVVVLSIHHIVCDGWSFAVLLEDLSMIYTGLMTGTHMGLPEANYYIDFLLSINDKKHGESQLADYDYWLKLYSKIPEPLDLPVDGVRQPVRSLKSENIEYQFDLEFYNQIKGLAKQQNCSVVSVLLAAYASLMYKLSGQREIVIALPAAGQAIEGWYRVIGHCVNTLPIPCYVDPEVRFSQFLHTFKDSFLDISDHQKISLGGLLKKLNVERDTSRLQLASLMFNLDQDIEKFDFADLEARIHPNGRLFENFDLFLNVVERESGYLLQWQYNSAIYKKASVETWASVYHKLLQQMCTQPELPIDSFEISLDQDFNQQQKITSLQQSEKQSLIQQLINKSHIGSDNVAAISSDEKLSYKQLDEYSNQLANYLEEEKGVKAGELIGVCMDRTVDLLPVLLAIWKCGCAYVPLDPSFPVGRLNYMVEESRLKIIICHSNFAQLIHPFPELNVLCIDQLAETINNKAKLFSPGELSPDNTAYVIFTSGSTGKPKGVMVPQSAVANFIESMAKTPGMKPDDKLLSVTTLSFDISVLELFLPLWVGGTVVMASSDESKNPVSLIKLITDHDVTIMQATPSTWQMLLNADWQGSNKLKVLCGGESFPTTLAKSIFSKVSEVWNMYGPTETTVWSTCYKIRDPDEPILIGTPINNTQCYILDEKLQPLPNGFTGELCIGGRGVSSGYLNQSELTNDRFVTYDVGASSVVIYRTGDKARWNHNGELEIYGRMDNQVKVRGFRIELGEIESVIQQHEQVNECAVAVKETTAGDMQLIAYVVWNEHKIDTLELRDYLLEWVPAYMVPQQIVDLTALPVTPNNKLDRNALPTPTPTPTPDKVKDKKIVQPKTATETVLSDVWKEALGLSVISTQDNFFDLGGHSILIAQIIQKFQAKKGVLLQYRDVFNHPTISDLAATIDTMSKDEIQVHDKIEVRTEEQKNVLSLAQESLWYLEKMNPNETHFNLPQAYRFSGALNKEALKQAFREMIERHEILRTGVVEENGVPVQCIYDDADFTLNEFDVSGVVKEHREFALHKQLDELHSNLIDISKPAMFYLALIRVSEEDHVLFFMPHHLIWDGLSFDVFIHEMTQLYAKNTNADYQQLENLPIQYADYAIWLRDLLAGHELDKQLDFWKKSLSGVLPLLEMPTDFPRPESLGNRGDTVYFEIDTELLDSLLQLANKHESSLFMVLIAAYVTIIYRYTEQTDIIIGTPMADRKRSGTENLIGFFVNSLVLRFNINPDESFAEFLKQVRELSLSGFANQDVPFEHLVKLLNQPRDLGRSPLFQTSLTYRDVSSSELTMGDIDLRQEEMIMRESAFDMNIWLKRRGSKILCGLVYNIDLFERETIEQFVKHYHNLLKTLPTSGVQSIRQLPLLLDEERRQQLALNNSTDMLWPGKQQIHQLISLQAEAVPSAIAVNFGDKQITYADLNNQSNQFSNYLIDIGVSNNAMVGLCVDRSIEMMVALLGILKAGCAYVPLDPEYPEDRLTYMVEDADLEYLVTQNKYTKQLPDVQSVVLIDDLGSLLTGQSTQSSEVNISDDAIAYVIYTSGSTGKPKGVKVHHAAATNFLNSMAQTPGLNKDDTLVAVTTLSFDIAVLELYLPLVVGGKLLIANKDEAIDGRRLLDLIRKHNVTAMQATPATWRMLIGSGWTKENKLKVLCGGEAMPNDLAHDLIQRSTELWNMYGPTETTVWSSCQKITDASLPLSIGKPISNTKLYILDECMQLVPQGVAGELFIGGKGVTKGYLNRDELTLDRFVDDPFVGNEKLYRTGDKVRYRRDNSLEYMGRLDSQVKVRGYRIELGEIESIMRQHDEISDCAIDLKEEKEGDARLVAYVIWKNNPLTMTELRQYLRNWIPTYMIPQHVLDVTELPRTPNGKLDRKNLPDIFSSASRGTDYIEPRSDEECWLADIWKELIGIDKVGLYDNFFELGGHSLLSMQVIHKISEKLDIVLNPRDLLLGTLEDVAKKLSKNEAHSLESGESEDKMDDRETNSQIKGIKGFFQRVFK